jgi:hypothetical protein
LAIASSNDHATPPANFSTDNASPIRTENVSQAIVQRSFVSFIPALPLSSMTNFILSQSTFLPCIHHLGAQPIVGLNIWDLSACYSGPAIHLVIGNRDLLHAGSLYFHTGFLL